ncbi:MAG: hypothetical protein EPN89_14805 [Methylovulum sp.]|nr:MAG: hypothetical protein EPN89_14805 [Methylovulum sp.]
MQPIRQVFLDAPEFIPVSVEFQHHSIELIIWPLEETAAAAAAETGEPAFLIADVNHIVMPSREERNARR